MKSEVMPSCRRATVGELIEMLKKFPSDYFVTIHDKPFSQSFVKSVHQMETEHDRDYFNRTENYVIISPYDSPLGDFVEEWHKDREQWNDRNTRLTLE